FCFAPWSFVPCMLLGPAKQRGSRMCALEVDGAEGGSITFHLQDLKGENLGWSFNGETHAYHHTGRVSQCPHFYEDSYMSRVTFPNNGRSLTISQLGKKDAGTYTAKTTPSPFPTGVLQEPKVTCVSRNCSANGCRYVLRCAVHTPEITSFSWSHGEQLDAEEPELVVEEEQRPGELDVLSYTCTVQNPVSSPSGCAQMTPPFTSVIAVTVIIALIILAVLLAFLIFRGKALPAGRRLCSAAPRVGCW
uniref:Ig-like domain-containing protein n=1 Tax=Anas platyrhynchos TaxID=8839 RepID=A0A8B9TAR0_ANAPL